VATPVLVLRPPRGYIVAIPFFGIITEIVPVFSRKPVFGYTTMVYATVSIAALSTAVWAHTCSPPAPYSCPSSHSCRI
jgi:heme/copper-type cytochrome/quinol oxidase subunit 1